jgi:hydrogenase-4 component F
MVFGETDVRPLPHSPSLVPVFVHLAIVPMLGPPRRPRAEWYRLAARLIG